jgi:drug/metabolite transporter (DMT)-like permease
MSGRELAWLALCGLFGVAANQVCFAEGLARTTALNAGVLMTTIPVITLGVAVMVGQETASIRRVLGVALALTGALLLVHPERFTLAAQGNLIVLCNCTCYAVYLVMVRRVLRRRRALTVTAWVFVFGALELSIVGGPALARAPLAAVSPATWLLAAYVIIGPTVVAYLLNTWALGRGADASTTALYAYVQPAVIAPMAGLALGERPTVRIVVATVIIFAGIYVAHARSPVRHASVAPPAS